MTTVQTIRERQGLGKLTPEEYHQERAARRAKNVANAREILARNGIEFTETWPSRDGVSICWVIAWRAIPDRPILYHPEIGTWGHSGGCDHFGCRNLVKYLRGECL